MIIRCLDPCGKECRLRLQLQTWYCFSPHDSQPESPALNPDRDGCLITESVLGVRDCLQEAKKLPKP